jgi:GDP-L-fucose synthase
MYNNNVKIIIFGSNGLVGSSIFNKLKKNKKFKEIVGSTRADTNLFNLEETLKTVDEINPDIIINAAAKVGGIIANNAERFEFITENLKININILEAIKRNNKIKLINLGSSCIYPLDAPNPIKEEYIMTGPLEPTNSPYAMAKLTAIEMGSALKLEYGCNIINLMPTNLYGPNDNFSETRSHVIPGLITRMHNAKSKKENTFEIWGTGKPLREFLFVEDLSQAIEFILENDIKDNLINIGSNEEISIEKLANLIKSTLNYKGELVFDDSKPDGNPRKLLDSSLIFNYGWKPEINLEDGLKLTYNWYLENLSN